MRYQPSEMPPLSRTLNIPEGRNIMFALKSPRRVSPTLQGMLKLTTRPKKST